MNDSQTWTIKRLLDWTSDFFASHNAESSRLAAEVLLAEALGCKRIDLYTRFDQEPSESERAIFRGWVKRHADGEPVAYLVGHREFFSLRFNVNSHVLIPRPETEHLVTEVIELAKGTTRQPLSIIDIGTGSGAIAIALAKHLATAEFVAVDISSEALAVASSNAETHQVAERIEFIESDLFDRIPTNRKFDFVVSNPPYIGQQERDRVAESVRNYEPESALFAPGDDGTTVIKRLINASPEWLKPEGWLLIEVSPFISEACEASMAGHRGYSDVRLIKDLARLDRVLMGRYSANSA